jgi:hypothetical protein
MANGNSFSGKLVFGGKSCGFKGVFDANGDFSGSVNRGSNQAPLQMELHLDFTDRPYQISGTVSDGTNTADILADQAVFNSRTNPAPLAGTYTMLFPPPSDASMPQGYGYGTVKVGTNGAVSFNGVLGDGTKVSQKSMISKDGAWPFYVGKAASKTSGAWAMTGFIQFGDDPGVSNFAGDLNWIKDSTATTTGFNTTVSAIGSAYTKTPSWGTRLLDFPNTAGNALLVIGDGVLVPTPAAKTLTLPETNKVSIVSGEKFSMSINTGNGTFKGSFLDAGGVSRKFEGVLFQEQNVGAGFFKADGETGSVIFQAP